MLISGKTIANYILEDASKRVQDLWSEKRIQPHLVVIQVGNNAASNSYIAQKKKIAEKIGAELSHYKLPEDISQDELLKTINFLQHQELRTTNHDLRTPDGIVVQLPLPSHIDRDTIIKAIDPEKDIDGFTQNSPYKVPVAVAIMHFLATIWQIESGDSRDPNLFPLDPRISSWLSEKHILVIGQGYTAGRPITELLRKEGFTVDTLDMHSPDPDEHINTADIIISCTGHPGLLNKTNLQDDVILLGVGMSRGADGEVHGDYEVPEIENIASYFTPTIGGVGPVNVACLFDNLVTAAQQGADLYPTEKSAKKVNTF